MPIPCPFVVKNGSNILSGISTPRRWTRTFTTLSLTMMSVALRMRLIRTLLDLYAIEPNWRHVARNLNIHVHTMS